MNLLSLPTAVREQLPPAGRAIYASALAKHAGKDGAVAHAWAWAAVEKAGLLSDNRATSVIRKDDPDAGDVHVNGPLSVAPNKPKRKKRPEFAALVKAVTDRDVDLDQPAPFVKAATAPADAVEHLPAELAVETETAPQRLSRRGGAGILKAALAWLRKARGNPHHDSKGRFSGSRTPDPATKATRNAEEAAGKGAMEHVLSTKTDFHAAMRRPDLAEPISFLWGNERGGVAHIVDKHGEEMARQMPTVLAHGNLGAEYTTARGRSRRNVTHGEHIATLSLQHEGAAHMWLLTGFRKRPR